MTEVFELPSLGADMESGTLLEWYVAPGDVVERGSVVALVSTDKADIDVEIWRSGTVDELLIGLDTEIPVGTPILSFFDGDDTETPARTTDADRSTERPTGPRHEPPPPHVSPAPGSAPPLDPVSSAPISVSPPAQTNVLASPLARATARERGIDLRSVHGSGPGGAVVVRDLETAVMAARLKPSTVAESPQAEGRASAMRQAIAARMATANNEIPHYYLEQDIDLEAMLAWLGRHNAALPIAERVLPAAVLLKATAIAAAKVPELNGFWVSDRFEPAASTDLAVVVSLRGGGLVTPRISDVDRLEVDEVMSALTEIVSGARRGSLRSSWMVGAGLTVTNLGERGADRVSGVIFPPQVALVGFGAIRHRPWVVDGEVQVRPVVTASLAADHRATDGAVGSRFLSAVAKALENMETL